jgi:predicted N-acetyltransferase YhbS
MTGIELVKSIFPGWATENMPEFDESIEIAAGGGVVCYVGMMKREILVNKVPHPVAGIGYVCTEPAHRGLGLMHQAMELAHKRGRQLGCQWAMLNTGHIGLYEPMGYVRALNLPPDWMVKPLGQWWDEHFTVDLQGTW